MRRSLTRLLVTVLCCQHSQRIIHPIATCPLIMARSNFASDAKRRRATTASAITSVECRNWTACREIAPKARSGEKRNPHRRLSEGANLFRELRGANLLIEHLKFPRDPGCAFALLQNRVGESREPRVSWWDRIGYEPIEGLDFLPAINARLLNLSQRVAIRETSSTLGLPQPCVARPRSRCEPRTAS